MEGAMVSLVSVGQDTGLRRFFGNPLVGIIGAVASVGSLILARVFYLQGQRYPELEYLAHPAPVVLAPPGGALQVQFNHRGAIIIAKPRGETRATTFAAGLPPDSHTAHR